MNNVDFEILKQFSPSPCFFASPSQLGALSSCAVNLQNAKASNVLTIILVENIHVSSQSTDIYLQLLIDPCQQSNMMPLVVSVTLHYFRSQSIEVAAYFGPVGLICCCDIQC
jgi:hypothetical protein